MQAPAGSVHRLVASRGAPAAVWVGGAERVSEVTERTPGSSSSSCTDSIVVPQGMPGPLICCPASKAPKLVLTSCTTAEAGPLRATPVAVAVARRSIFSSPGRTSVTVVPAGRPGPLIVWPTENPTVQLTFLIVLEWFSVSPVQLAGPVSSPLPAAEPCSCPLWGASGLRVR